MCCVQSIILHHQTPSLLDPLSPARLTLLAVLLINCINTSTILPQCPKQPLVAAFDGTPLACDSEQFETVLCLCVYLSVSCVSVGGTGCMRKWDGCVFIYIYTCMQKVHFY